MADFGTFISDPWTIRMVVSITAGAITGLLVVRITFHLHNQRDLHKALRGIRAELEHNIDQLAKLTRLLEDDMRRQQIDLPIEVPAGTSMEIRYLLTLPSSLHTSAFEQLKQSGRLNDLPDDLRQQLFDLYDVIDRINRLHKYRETLHYNNIDNVHIVIDSSAFDLEPGETLTEERLPEELRGRLEGSRRMRRAMAGLNKSILRLVASISSPEHIERLDLGDYLPPDSTGDGTDGASGGPEPSAPNIESVIAALESIEEDAFWARFV